MAGPYRSREPSPTDNWGMTDLPEQALRDQCTVFLTGHGPLRPADLLASIPADTVPDRYGDGGVVTELEAEIAGLLGTSAAVYLPSGTMAQQSVLRVHADRRQRRAVVYHPLCHLDRHEDRAFQRLHGLTGRPAGDHDRLLTVDDLTTIAEPPGTLLIELPQRDLGGQQPDWDDLRAQTEWACQRGAAVHLDGARLYESAAGSRLGADLPAAQAPADAGLPGSRPRDRVRPARGPGRPGRSRPAAGLDDAPAAGRHPGGFRRRGSPAGRRGGRLDLAAGHDHARSRCAAGRAVRRRRHPRPASRPGP